VLIIQPLDHALLLERSTEVAVLISLFSVGLLIGGILGTLIGRLVVYLRARNKEPIGLNELLAFAATTTDP